MTKAFVSYSHRQGDWVWDRLVPVLRAGGAEPLIDRERFDAGEGVVGQMDAIQDQADQHLLVLSEDYLRSDYCRHELERAVATDPDFTRGSVIPVKRLDCTRPPELHNPTPLAPPDPLYLDLRDDGQPEPWAMLLAACGADLGCDAPHWLQVRDRVRDLLDAGHSVNLAVSGQPSWRPLIDQLRSGPLPQLGLVNLERGATAPRRGLILEILTALGHRPTLPGEPNDLAELERLLCAGPRATLALTHCDLVAHRPQYGVDLIACLRYLMMDARKLVLLAQSRSPFSTLLPRDHPLSEIDIQTVELRGAP
jgi:hypothetical protein